MAPGSSPAPPPPSPPPPSSPPPPPDVLAAPSGSSSSFSSPLPPCPEDPPAPPPPACTPPKYQPPLEEEHESAEDDDDDDEPATPPPPLSPPSASPPVLLLGSPPPPPPPPPFSPPSAKIELAPLALELCVDANDEDGDDEANAKSDDALSQQSAAFDAHDEENDSADTAAPPAAELRKTDSSGDRRGKASPTSLRSPRGGPNAAAIRSSSSSVIASMRSAASEREILAPDFPRDPPAERPRWYVGDIESYSIIDKVGSGTYGEVFKCQHKVTKDIVALKKLRPDVEKNGFPVTSIREMKILKFLKHPNVVALKEIVSSSAPPKEGKRPPLYFAFEYMEHDLSGLLNHPRLQLIFGLCGMPTEETWPGFFKLHGAKSFEMDEKYVCRLRDRFKNLPKFHVSSTHEYQSKKRHHEEMAAAAAAAGANGAGGGSTEQQRHVRARGERGYRPPDRNEPYRPSDRGQPSHPHRSSQAAAGHHQSSRGDHGRPFRHRDSDYYDRDRDRARDRERSRSRERARERERERERGASSRHDGHHHERA
ncbi:hypothetical protein PybrP1_000162 [[Pythium] brassicae (nom. inval.)]|nr:hypothetical protein PybrP1_000162 [[Pythium] brassicae (nom. inval.)]